MVAENPSDHAQALSAFTGVRDFAATSAGLTFVTPRGTLAVRTLTRRMNVSDRPATGSAAP
jgi:hypothetical protein